jgi:hypothetical protein
MSAKTEYQALEDALREAELQITCPTKSRKNWCPAVFLIPRRQAEFRILVKEFWTLPSEEDVPSPSNEDLFWDGDKNDRERIVERLSQLLAQKRFIKYSDRFLRRWLGHWRWRRNMQERVDPRG